MSAAAHKRGKSTPAGRAHGGPHAAPRLLPSIFRMPELPGPFAAAGAPGGAPGIEWSAAPAARSPTWRPRRRRRRPAAALRRSPPRSRCAARRPRPPPPPRPPPAAPARAATCWPCRRGAALHRRAGPGPATAAALGRQSSPCNGQQTRRSLEAAAPCLRLKPVVRSVRFLAQQHLFPGAARVARCACYGLTVLTA